MIGTPIIAPTRCHGVDGFYIPGHVRHFELEMIRGWTHAIRGLHRNDFIMAAKSDQAYKGNK